nr:MAG TPA: hypothetical protein [Caudoviricetes sp.]
MKAGHGHEVSRLARRSGAVQQRPPFRSSPMKNRAAVLAEAVPAWI